MNSPFYYTWSKQDHPRQLKCSQVEQDYFILDNGEKILDLSSISFQANFGHRPKFIEDQIKKQVDVFCLHSPQADFPLKQQVANRIIELLKVNGGKIFYTVSGAETVENALKLARLVTGKKIVASRANSYHGATLGAISVGGDWRSDAPVTSDEWTLRIPEPQEDPNAKGAREEISRMGSDKIAAICLETITGVNGVIIPPRSWYIGIQKICDEFNIKLILDEVMCGFYRTGKAFAFHHYRPILKPDFVCMAKAINGGLTPFGALWTDSSIAKHFESRTLSAGLTNYAHPLGLASSLAVLDYTETADFKESLRRNAETFKNTMSQLEKLDNIQRVNHIGMLAAIETNLEIPWEKFIKEGLYLVTRDNRIILAPSLIMDNNALTCGLEKLYQIISS